MSLLVHYTLKSADDHQNQRDAMITLVDGLKGEGIPGLHYSCFSTSDPVKFIGVLEYSDDTEKQAFLNSTAFETYKKTVGPTFLNSPNTVEISEIATTR